MLYSCEEKERGFYANHVEEIMNVFEYEYEGKDKNQKTTFRWITNLEINKRNLEELIQAGRWRWKIENIYSSPLIIKNWS